MKIIIIILTYIWLHIWTMYKNVVIFYDIFPDNHWIWIFIFFSKSHNYSVKFHFKKKMLKINIKTKYVGLGSTSIKEGGENWFDVPFRSKISIVRYTSHLLLFMCNFILKLHFKTYVKNTNCCVYDIKENGQIQGTTYV